jgi:hypothetical protein
MKQYTNEIQTAKLIELGFEKPESIIDAWAHETDIDMEYVYEYAYSIGELIDMLGGVSELEITRFGSGWGAYDDLRAFTSEELIDALYDMIIMLKEEGII